MAADKAYEFFNNEHHSNGLRINVPETHRDVCKEEIPLWVRSMGGHAVVKVPYSNAGQGVYTITNEKELEAMMAEPEMYNKFIVQSLIGNSSWSSQQAKGKFFHCGSIPNKKGQIFCSDLRVMVMGTKDGFAPVAIYARSAKNPLVETLSPDDNSWDILGTNLSKKMPDGKFTTETDRLRLMDTKDFNTLGLGLDDLIEAYVQTVLMLHERPSVVIPVPWYALWYVAVKGYVQTILHSIHGANVPLNRRCWPSRPSMRWRSASPPRAGLTPSSTLRSTGASRLFHIVIIIIIITCAYFRFLC
jgi:hypothetical protein